MKIDISSDSINNRSESFKIHNESGQRKTQADRALVLFQQGHTLSSRLLSIKLGVERSNATRIIADLKEANKIKLIRSSPCEYTRRRVGFYCLVKNGQSELFAPPSPKHWDNV